MEYGSVILDMDGVLLDFRGDGFQWKYDAVREVLEEKGVDTSGMDRSELDTFLGDKGVDPLVEACNGKGLDAGEIWTLIAEATTRARKRQFEQGTFELFPEVRAVLDALREEEVLLGLISNAPEQAVKLTMDHYDLRDHFKFFRGIESFEDLPDRKPHPDHLEIAKAELKRGPYLYAGDAESDIIAARSAGMDSARVDRSDASLDVKPDHTVESLNGLRAIVEEG